MFYLVPLVRGLYNSLTDYNILQSPKFKGIQNYQSLLHDDIFWNSLKVTVEYVGINISNQMTGGLLIAVLMDRLWISRSIVIRCALVFPWLVPNVAVATISLFMLDRTVGVVNRVLADVDVPGQYFYQRPHEAIATVALVVIHGETSAKYGSLALRRHTDHPQVPLRICEDRWCQRVEGVPPR